MSPSNDEGWNRRRILQTTTLFSGGFLPGSNSVAARSRNKRRDRTREINGHTVAQSINCDQKISGELTPDDPSGFKGKDHAQKLYQLAVPEDTFATISLETLQPEDPEEGSNDPFLYLLDSNGTILAADDDGAGELNSKIRTFPLQEGNQYAILATSFAPKDYFEYELSVDCFDLRPERSINCGETVTCALGPDAGGGEDTMGFRGPDFFFDVFSFEGTARQVVSISAITLDTEKVNGPSNGGRGDPYLYLLDPHWNAVAETFVEDDNGPGKRTIFPTTLREEGQYMIVVTSAEPNSRFPYRLSLNCPPTPDPQSIECSQTLSGELTTDDYQGFPEVLTFQDRYSFEGTAGDKITVFMTAEESEGSPLLFLLDPNGNLLAEDASGFRAVIVQRLLPADGEYTIIASSERPNFTFPYRLSLTCDPTPIEPPPECEKIIECNTVIDDAFEPSDRGGVRDPFHHENVYCVNVEAGTSITISMAAGEFALGSDSYLYLLDPDGNVVAFDDDSGGGALAFDSLISEYEIPQSGRYTIIATSFSPGESFEYTLSLQCH